MWPGQGIFSLPARYLLAGMMAVQLVFFAIAVFVTPLITAFKVLETRVAAYKALAPEDQSQVHRADICALQNTIDSWVLSPLTRHFFLSGDQRHIASQ